MRKFIISAITSSFLMVNTSSAMMPVFDAQALIQDTMSYIQDTQALVNQIKDMMMFDKQLAAMGIDLSQINGFINQMKDSWEQLNEMRDKVENITNLENLWNELQGDCNILKQNSQFADMIKEKAKDFKGLVDSKFAEVQACAELVGNKEVQQELEKKSLIEAQQCLIEDDSQCFKQKLKEVNENRKKLEEHKNKTQYAAISKVTNAYRGYDNSTKGTKAEIQKSADDLQKEVSKLSGKEEKYQREVGIKIQQMMLDILVKQYDLMQNTSNMMAVMIQQSQQIYDKKIETDKELKLNSKFNDALDSCEEVKKDDFGFPNFESGKTYCNF